MAPHLRTSAWAGAALMVVLSGALLDASMQAPMITFCAELKAATAALDPTAELLAGLSPEVASWEPLGQRPSTSLPRAWARRSPRRWSVSTTGSRRGRRSTTSLGRNEERAQLQARIRALIGEITLT